MMNNLTSTANKNSTKASVAQTVTLVFTILAEAGKIRTLMSELDNRSKKYFKIDEVRDMNKALSRIFKNAEELRELIHTQPSFETPAHSPQLLSLSLTANRDKAVEKTVPASLSTTAVEQSVPAISLSPATVELSVPAASLTPKPNSLSNRFESAGSSFTAVEQSVPATSLSPKPTPLSQRFGTAQPFPSAVEHTVPANSLTFKPISLSKRFETADSTTNAVERSVPAKSLSNEPNLLSKSFESAQPPLAPSTVDPKIPVNGASLPRPKNAVESQIPAGKSQRKKTFAQIAASKPNKQNPKQTSVDKSRQRSDKGKSGRNQSKSNLTTTLFVSSKGHSFDSLRRHIMELIDPIKYGFHISYLAKSSSGSLVIRFQKSEERDKAKKLVEEAGYELATIHKPTVRAILDSKMTIEKIRLAFSNQNPELNLLPDLWSLSHSRPIGDGSRSLFFFDAPASEIAKVEDKRLFIGFSRPSFWSRAHRKAKK